MFIYLSINVDFNLFKKSCLGLYFHIIKGLFSLCHVFLLSHAKQILVYTLFPRQLSGFPLRIISEIIALVLLINVPIRSLQRHF